jgi:hypothetical protein
LFARDLAEYLTDDRKGILQREGGIMSLIDLWALFNRLSMSFVVTIPRAAADSDSTALVSGELSLVVIPDLAEYLTDDRKGILQREGGIMSLIDLWAVFNRSRNK